MCIFQPYWKWHSERTMGKTFLLDNINKYMNVPDSQLITKLVKEPLWHLICFSVEVGIIYTWWIGHRENQTQPHWREGDSIIKIQCSTFWDGLFAASHTVACSSNYKLILTSGKSSYRVDFVVNLCFTDMECWESLRDLQLLTQSQPQLELDWFISFLFIFLSARSSFCQNWLQLSIQFLLLINTNFSTY